MTLPSNFNPRGLVPIVIISDADGVEQYRFEHPLAVGTSICAIQGDGNILDSSGNQNHGTWTGTEAYGPAAIGKAMKFNSTSYVTLANESNFDVLDRDAPWSIMIKCKPTTTANGTLFSKKDTSGTDAGIWVWKSDDDVFFYISDGTTNHIIQNSSNFVTNDDNTIIVTHSGNSNKSGMKAYVNGVVNTGGGSAAMVAAITNNESPILGRLGDGGVTYTGLEQHVVVFDSELSQADVNGLTAINTTPVLGTPEQDFPMMGYHLHGGIGSDLGRLIITLDDRSNTFTNLTDGRRPSLFKPLWKIDMYMMYANDTSNPVTGTAKANMDSSKLWFSGFLVDPQVERPINNYQRQTLFAVGVAMQLTERMTSMKRTQTRASDGISFDTSDPLKATDLVTDLITKTDHFLHTGLPALSSDFNVNEVTDSDITFADFNVHFYTIHQALQEIAARAGYIWGVKPDGTIYMFPRGTQDSGLLLTNDLTSSVTTGWDKTRLCTLRNVPTGYIDSGAGVGYSILHGVGGVTDFLLHEQTLSDAVATLTVGDGTGGGVPEDVAFPFIPTEDSLARLAIFGSQLAGTTSGISVANPSVLTDTGHGLENGQTITISSSDTTPNIDGDHIITWIDANSFSIPVNVTVSPTGIASWVSKSADPLHLCILSDNGDSEVQQGILQFTNNGTAGDTLTSIDVAGTELILTPVVWDTDLATFSRNVAEEINNNITFPNYRASSYVNTSNDGVVTIYSLEVDDYITAKSITATVSPAVTLTHIDGNMLATSMGHPSRDLRRRIKVEPDRLNQAFDSSGAWLELPFRTINSGTRLTPYTVHWLLLGGHNSVRVDYQTTVGSFSRGVGGAWIHDSGSLKVRIHHSHSIDVIIENTVAKKTFGTREILLPISDFPSEEAALNGLMGFSQVTSRAQRVYQPVQAYPPQKPPELGKSTRIIDKFNGMDTFVDIIGYDIQATSFSKWNQGVDSMTFHIEETYYPE